MAVKYTAEEKNALYDKAKNPQKKVLCPRCGKQLNYRSVNASYEVKCSTEMCLKMSVRGL